MDKINLATIRQTFANTVFTHKVQEIAAEFNQTKSFYVKIVNISLVGVVLVLLVLQLSFASIAAFSYIGAGVTVGEIIFLIIQLSFGFEQQTVTNKNSALKYLQLRDKYRLLIADVMNENITSDELISRRDLLQSEYQVISDLAPQTGSEEYIMAQKRLNTNDQKNGEQCTWADEEIDRFLPENLRINKI
jgi:hypothetical protein